MWLNFRLCTMNATCSLMAVVMVAGLIVPGLILDRRFQQATPPPTTQGFVLIITDMVQWLRSSDNYASHCGMKVQTCVDDHIFCPMKHMSK